MGDDAGGWRERAYALLERAPAWMGELASPELHIGGMTNVRLAHPVLDVTAVADAETAERALVFFVAACLVHRAPLGRVCCAAGQRDGLSRLAHARLGAGIERVDAESAALMGYFDLYLRVLGPDDPAGPRVLAALAESVEDRARGPR